MSRQLLAGLLAVALQAVICGYASSTRAHALSTNTARLTLRDGHVELLLEVDVLGWLGHLAEEQNEAPQDSRNDPAKVSLALAQARLDLERESVLMVDGKVVSLTVRSFPDVSELARAILASQASEPGSAIHLPVRLEARLQGSPPKQVSLLFPHELGAVLVTLVQPQSRLASAGAPARFEVLRPSREPSPAAQHGASTGTHLSVWPWLGAACLGLAYWWRRRSAHGSRSASLV